MFIICIVPVDHGCFYCWSAYFWEFRPTCEMLLYGSRFVLTGQCWDFLKRPPSVITSLICIVELGFLCSIFVRGLLLSCRICMICMNYGELECIQLQEDSIVSCWCNWFSLILALLALHQDRNLCKFTFGLTWTLVIGIQLFIVRPLYDIFNVY